MASKQPTYSEVSRRQAELQHAAEVGDLRRQLAQHAEVIAALEEQLGVASALRKAARKPAGELRVVARGGGASQAAAVVCLSDWHVEETVDSAAVNGLNSYDMGVADARIASTFRSIMRLVEIERHGTDIDTLVLHLGGDLMSGYIHDELAESNSLSPSETVLWLLPRLRAGIEALRKDGGFTRIVVPCSYGNHGRTTIKPRVSTGASNSYEWLLYRVLAESITEGVEWHVADGYHVYVDVYDRALRFHHGDAIGFQGGVGGITIPVNKKIAEWNKARPAYLDVFGHHHTSLAGKNFVSNGSLIGYGPYSVKIGAAYEAPSQTLFLLDAKRGRTAVWPILVEG